MALVVSTTDEEMDIPSSSILETCLQLDETLETPIDQPINDVLTQR